MPDAEERIRRAVNSECGQSAEPVLENPQEARVDMLLALLRSAEASEVQQRRAMYLLGRLGVRDAIDPILELLPRLDTAGRISALDALGRIGGADARRALVARMDDPVPQVRQFAVLGLGRVGGKPAAEALRRASTADPEPFVRATARREAETMSSR